MVKKHLKRLSAPRSWEIDRKERTFVTRPKPGKPFALSMPLNQVMKGLLGKGTMTREVKHLLEHDQILLNGKRVHSHRVPVGFMDVVSFPSIDEHHVITLSRKGRLAARKVGAERADERLVKIRDKTRHKGGVQINCFDGTNVLVDQDQYSTGDTLVLEDGEVKEHLPLEQGATVMLTGGSHISSVGVVKAIGDDTITLETPAGEESTARRYAFVVRDEHAEEELS